MKTVILLMLGLAALGLLSGCSSDAVAEDSPAAQGVTEVAVRDMKFTPRVIEVPAGTAVTWSFQDGTTPHDVKGEGFKSEILRDGHFTFTFDTPGRYDYRCTLHPGMTGRIIVT